MSRGAALAALALAACAHGKAVVGPPARATAQPSWKTLKAEHRVALDVTLDGGKHDRRTLRGVIAVEQPDKFRLRALGPGGITLFDLLWVHGEAKVLQAIRDPRSSQLGPVLEALAGDLSAAFRLQPAPPGRTITVENDGAKVRIEEPDRTVESSRVVAHTGVPVETRLDIANRARHYTVGVDAESVEVDQPLDPALFTE